MCAGEEAEEEEEPTDWGKVEEDGSVTVVEREGKHLIHTVCYVEGIDEGALMVWLLSINSITVLMSSVESVNGSQH